MRGLIITAALALAFAVLTPATACVSTREQHAEAIKSARTALNKSPGAPREAMRFADALTWNLHERDAGDRETVTDDEVAFAADNLEQAAERVPEEAALLLEREGALWLAARDAARAEDAYRRSLKAKPTKPALWALIGIAGRKNNVEQVRALCVEGAAAIPDHELRDHLQTCASAAKLTSADTALEWLKDEDRERHLAHRARARENERKQQEAIQEAQKKFAVCSASCDESAAGCLARCDAGQPQCPKACEARREACTTKCKAAVSR